MTGEIKVFRKRFFGGFNKKDVIDYITEQARERNEMEAAKEKAEKELLELVREVTRLRIETEVAWRLAKVSKEEALPHIRSTM